jgi:hypothetical protein
MVAEPISPELVLVCPELRKRVLAGLPEPVVPPAPREALAPLPVRIGVYLALRTAETAAEGAVFAAVVTALVLALSLTA